MIVKIGNIFETKCSTIVNTVNCVGVMGKGIALEFKKRYPEMFLDYVKRCNMSEVNFRRLFKEYTGMSPIEYRNNIRLINAKNKLQSDEYNVSETAELCGFSNLSFFIRLYKKKYGCTPKRG